MSKFCCGVSGARSLNFLEGIGKQTKGARFQIEFYSEEAPFFPPSRQMLDEMEVRDLHLYARDQLDWGIFKDLSAKERVNKIQSEAQNAEIYLSDLPCRVKFLDLGESEFNGEKISEENRQRLMGGEWIEMSEVYAMFPVLSRARRHSLIFRPSNWAIYNPDALVNYSLYINLLNGEYSKSAPDGLQCFKAEYMSQGKKIFIGVCDEPSCRDLDAFISPEVKEECAWFSPAIFKSLMQKCIRVRPVQVASMVKDRMYPVESVLISSFIILLKHPGAFVPNLNAFVNGAESALKRLGVSLIEDSVGSLEAVSCLFAAALASRNGYFPSMRFARRCVQWALEGLGSSYLIYDSHNALKSSASLSEGEKRCCAFLEALGSFECDIKMVYSAFSLKRIMPELFPRPAVMPIYHCLDQHSICEIAHLHIEQQRADSSEIFSRIWLRGAGLNSRKKAFQVDSFVADAQKWLWILKTRDSGQLVRFDLRADVSFQGQMNLDRSWIAGLIGPMSQKFGFQELISFYDPENIDKVVSIRRPSRDSDVYLDEEARNKAALKAIADHSSRPILIKSPLLNLSFECLYQNGDFACKNVVSGERFQWNEYCQSAFELPLLLGYEPPSPDDFHAVVKLAASFDPGQKGVHEEALSLIEAYVLKQDKRFLMRLGLYLRPVKSAIMINKLSRDGKGAYLMVAPEDSQVFRFLLYVCCLAPGVLKFEPSCIRFQVKFFPYWGLIRSLVLGLIEAAPQHQWSVVPENKRPLYENQVSAIESILDRIAAGKRGHLLWMDVGLGKTQIVLSIMEALVKEGKMPRYCFFIISPSSEENICNQIAAMGLKAHKLDPRKGPHRMINPKDNCVNLVFHDHMDDLHEQLKDLACDAFFLFDEVHYMFGNSKRSSVALELAKVCNMFIAMTGTLVRNKDIQKDHIIDWLGQVVDFEVSPENYMIGVASLVSGKRELPIKQNRIEVEVPVLNPAYYDHVDSHFGGRASKVDYHRAALICFESVFEGIKQRVLFHRGLNHGCLFVVAKDKAMQKRLHDDLSALGLKCFSVANGNSISIQSDHNPAGYEVIIASPRQETGYDVTAAKYMISAPYPSNEASRVQLVGRIVRLSQKAPEVFIEIVHCGILSYSMKHHEVARLVAKSLSGMQKEV